MKRMTYVTEKGEILFHPKDLPDDEGMTITQLAEDGRFKALEQIAEILANREQADELGVYGKWIPVSERLPEEPKENEIFDNKPLELYLVSIKGDPYPFRAFWNGKFFTNGWQKCEVTAWMPLPEPYRESDVDYGEM